MFDAWHYNAVARHYSAITCHYSAVACHYSAVACHYSAVEEAPQLRKCPMPGILTIYGTFFVMQYATAAWNNPILAACEARGLL